MTQWLEKEIDSQVRWVAEHGATESGYVARYGSINDAEYYGSGGETIYKADMETLEKLRARLAESKGPSVETGREILADNIPHDCMIHLLHAMYEWFPDFVFWASPRGYLMAQFFEIKPTPIVVARLSNFACGFVNGMTVYRK